MPERRLADVVLNFPGDLAGYTATELATISEVSNTAGSRFVRRLGFAGHWGLEVMSRELRAQPVDRAVGRVAAAARRVLRPPAG